MIKGLKALVGNWWGGQQADALSVPQEMRTEDGSREER